MGVMLCPRFMGLVLLASVLVILSCFGPSCFAQAPPVPQPYFEIWSPQRTGITWKHDNAMSTRRYLPESMGPGVAIFDYDNDGWMDLYFVNSGPADFFAPATPLHNALYHNNHDGTFTEVTQKAGVGGRDFGIGVAAAD